VALVCLLNFIPIVDYTIKDNVGSVIGLIHSIKLHIELKNDECDKEVAQLVKPSVSPSAT